MRSGIDGARRIEAIDALRGAAALLVATMHVRQMNWTGMRAYLEAPHDPLGLGTLVAYLLAPSTFGLAGVPLFFVLSGYVIHRGAAARLAADPGWTLDVRRYYWRRFLRIYPVLLAALVLTAVVDQVVATYAPAGARGRHDAATFLVNLFSLQGVAGPPFGSNSPLWTLSVEVHFYLVYPLLLWVLARLGPTWTLAGALLVSAVSWMLVEPRGIVVFATYYAAWYAGAYVAWGTERLPTMTARARAWIRRGAWLALLIGTATGCAAMIREMPVAAFQAWAVGATGLLWLVLGARRSGGLGVRWLAWLGGFSYSLYIIHKPLAVAFPALVTGGPVPSIWPTVSCLMGCVGAAYLFHLAFERPFVRMLERKSTGSAGPVAQVGVRTA